MVQSLDMSPEGETEVVLEKPKRAPRKRTPKVVSDTVVETPVVKRAPRKRVAKKVVEKEEDEVEIKEEKQRRSSTRKAPTSIVEDREEKKKSRRQFVVVALMIIVGVGASAGVGLTDKGTIDVISTIEYRNEQARSSGNNSAIIPVQNANQEVDGGLIGMGIGGPIEGSTTTPAVASTTEAVASSTALVPQAPLSNMEAEAVAAALEASSGASEETPAQ